MTLEIRAIEAMDNGTGDAAMLPRLRDQVGSKEAIASVNGDGAYDTKACHEAIALRGAQAINPTRKNDISWKDHRSGLGSATPYWMLCGTLVVEYGRSGPATIDAV